MLIPIAEDIIANEFNAGKITGDEYFAYLEKSKHSPIGSISPNGKFEKVAEGKWVPIKKEREKKSEENEESKKQSKLSAEKLKDYADKTSTKKLEKFVDKTKDKKLKKIAENELATRNDSKRNNDKTQYHTVAKKEIAISHFTDGKKPVISTNKERLIPNSISFGETGKGLAGFYGKNKFNYTIPKDSKILEVDVNKDSFWDFANDETKDSPIDVGKNLYNYAKENNIDIIKIKNVPGVGTEYSVLNLDAINKHDMEKSELIEDNKLLKSYCDLLEDNQLIKSELIELIDINPEFVLNELNKAEANSTLKQLYTPYLDVIEKAVKNKNKKIYADGIITNMYGKILLLLRNSPKPENKDLNNKWCLPGGSVDNNEEPEQAIIREIKEETNLDVEGLELLTIKDKENCRIHYFLCMVDYDSLEILDNNEHKNLKWVSTNELKSMELIYDLKETILELMTNTPVFIEKSVDDSMLIIKQAFDEEQITSEQYFQALEKAKQKKKILHHRKDTGKTYYQTHEVGSDNESEITKNEWEQILNFAFRYQPKLHLLSPKKINNGYCDFVAEAGEKVIDGAKWHSTNEQRYDYLPKDDEGNHDHSWFEYNGKCYDIEAKNGVNKPEDLPFFKRLKKEEQPSHKFIDDHNLEKAEKSSKLGDEKIWHGRKFKLEGNGWVHKDDKNSQLKIDKEKTKLKIQDFSDEDLEKHAERASDADLQKIVKESRHPKLRTLAQKHLANRKARETEHTLYDLMIMEDSETDTFNEDNVIHFDKHPGDDVIDKLNKNGVKYLVGSKEINKTQSK